MKKLHLAILLVPSLILGGCATLDKDGCPYEKTRLNARDGGKVGTGNRPSFINMSRDTVPVAVGCSFVLLNPDGHEIHTTSTEAWLTWPATTGDITMGPAQGNSGDVFKYTIHIKDIGQLDPRGRIR